MFRSLRVRMALSHAAVLAVILFALGGGGLLLLSRSLDRAATREINDAAISQAHRILEAGRPVPPLDSDVQRLADVRVAVFNNDGSPLTESSEIPSWLQPRPSGVADITAANVPVRVVTIHVMHASTNLATVVAGRSLAPEDRLLERVRLLLLFGGAAAILASLAAGWWLAGRAVRPVQRAYEAQAGFAADASHELRSPLTFIRSGVEVMAEKDQDLGGQVLSEVDYLTGLTQRLLLIARADREQAGLERRPLDVAEVCRSATRRSERVHGNRLTVEGDERVSALGDGVATEAALDAVLENVGVHGGGEATISWENGDGRVLVSVVDHGPGLPSELERSAFERFFRADPSRTRDTGGAGLGLALARSLVQAEGGSMWLDQTPGGGLTARISLPAASAGE